MARIRAEQVIARPPWANREQRAELTDEEKVRRVTQILLARAKKARSSLTEFFNMVMREETSRARITVAPHQQVMFEFVEAHPECVIMLPVGHTKTFSMSAMGLYYTGHNATLRGAIVSATQGQAAKPLRAIRDYIENSDELKLVFPELQKSTRKGDPWTETMITVDRPPGIRDATLVAVGMEGAIAGARLNWVLTDDILNHENTNTPDQREKVYEWFMSSVYSRLDPRGSRIVVSNTAWHPKDLVHRLRDQGWPTIRMEMTGDIEISNTTWDPQDPDALRPSYPGSALCRLSANDPDPKNEQTLWPGKFDKAAMEHIRSKHLPSEFNRLYKNVTRDDDTAMCKQEFIDKCLQAARQRGIHEFVYKYTGPNLTFTGVDLAVSPGEEHDDTAFFTFEVLPSGHRRILEIECGQWDGPTIVNKMFDKLVRYNSILRVENNAAQDFIRQFALQRNISAPIKAHCTGRTKAHPEHGVPGLFVELSNGAWLIPNDNQGRFHPMVKRFIEACLYYSPSKHTDDALMACYFAREQAKEFGVLSGGDTANIASGSIGMSVMSR